MDAMHVPISQQAATHPIRAQQHQIHVRGIVPQDIIKTAQHVKVVRQVVIVQAVALHRRFVRQTPIPRPVRPAVPAVLRAIPPEELHQTHMRRRPLVK